MGRFSRHRACALGVCAALGLAGAAAAPAPAADEPAAAPEAQSQAGPGPRIAITRLSDERTLSRWAHPARSADIYRRPTTKSRKVGRLRFFTEDGFPEVYLLLQQQVEENSDRDWVQIRVPKRPNGTKGWVPRDALGPFNRNRHLLVINRTTLRATLYKRGRKVFSTRVGVGKRGTPTPAGRFWIREKFRFKSTPVYGTHAMGTAAYSPTLNDWPNGGVVGIHGTNQPWLIPGRPSHGCIRIRNAAIARLYRLTPVGTPLWIR